MLNWKSWTAALLIATGAFWLVMAHNPPVLGAATGPAAYSSYDFVPVVLPTAEGANAY